MAKQDQKSDISTSELNSLALSLAEQLGRIAGTLEGTAESLLNRASLADQLTQVRDGAAQLLDRLSSGASMTTKTRSLQQKDGRGSERGASADPARAPGKRRRKPGPSVRGAKHSDSRIPKLRAAVAARQRRKLYA
jgi:hypothetical protein